MQRSHGQWVLLARVGEGVGGLVRVYWVWVGFFLFGLANHVGFLA